MCVTVPRVSVRQFLMFTYETVPGVSDYGPVSSVISGTLVRVSGGYGTVEGSSATVSLAWREVRALGCLWPSQTWVQYEKVFVGEPCLGRAVPVGRCPYCSTHHLISARPVRLLPQITARSASLTFFTALGGG